MDAVNVLMLLLVCAFTSAEDSLKITCENGTGYVGKKLTLTCRVSDQSDTCNIRMYKFMNKDKGTEFCREEFTSYSCKQLTIFSCSYTANEALTSSFKFFILTTRGASSADFTVTITGEPVNDQISDTNAAEPENKPVQRDNTMPLAMPILAICVVIMAVVGVILQRKYNCLNVLQRGNNLSQCEENNTPEESHPLEKKHPPEYPKTEEV